MPFIPKFSITLNISNALVEIERVRGFLDAIKLKEKWFSDLQKEILILETHYSTHIEGTALSLEQAKNILEGNKVKDVNADDKKELLNYKKAMGFVSKYLGRDDPITEGLIREIHKILVKGVRGEKADPGNYRKIQNYVVNSITKEIIYTPPSPLEVPRLMRELVDWLNDRKNISPIIISGITQYQFVHIHPFLDGNGRTARLLSTLILYKTDYDFKRLFTISQYYDKDRPAYYQAIQSVRNNKLDMTNWLEYFIEGLKIQMFEIKEKGERIIKREKLVKKIRTSELNDRQEKALRYIINFGKISVNEYQIKMECIRRTAQRDLADLVKKGILKTVSTSSTDPTKYYQLL